jgi:response regulator NasT
MTRPLRIAVADDEPDMRDYFRRCLTRLGHQVVAVVDNGRDLVECCHRLRPQLVITDVRMPELDGIDAAGQIYADHPVPIILVSAYHDAALIERAEADHALAYLVKPIKQADLEPAIGLALRRFEQLEALRREAADLRQALADRRVLEQAKAVLMKGGAADEQEAFGRLQRRADETSRKLVEAAREILAAAQPSELRDERSASRGRESC